jgi:hypothetical protein
MSGSIALSAATFSDAEKADVRRFCGYPAYGAGSSGFSGWRFFDAYGELEFRMNNLAPAEYQVVRQYMAQLYVLEAAIVGAGANLDTDMAAVWTHNRAEVQDRVGLYGKWRRELAGIIGVPAGPALASGFRVIV